MRIANLVEELKSLVNELQVEGWREFRTRDNTRIDYAITKDATRLLAIEFEKSRKWLFARVLYNAVKAQRAEFPAILFVYPFYDLPRAGRSWVPTYVEDILGLRLALCHPRDCIVATRALLFEQLELPLSKEVSEKDWVITKNQVSAPSLKIGAKAWQKSRRSPTKKRKKPRRSTSKGPRTKKKT
jgi:hypothetical protein